MVVSFKRYVLAEPWSPHFDVECSIQRRQKALQEALSLPDHPSMAAENLPHLPLICYSILQLLLILPEPSFPAFRIIGRTILEDFVATVLKQMKECQWRSMPYERPIGKNNRRIESTLFS